MYILAFVCACVILHSLERGSGRMHILKPEEKMMYTWDNPTGRQGFLWQLVEATNASWLSLSLDEVRQGDQYHPHVNASS